MKLDHSMIRCDYHMHTGFSSDSEAPVRSMLNASIERGLTSVCITDHLDLDYPEDEELGPEPFRLDLEKYFQALTRIREEYSGKLDVRIGVEMGLQPHLGETYQRLAESYPFDFIIGSLHLVHGMDPYYGKIFEGKTDREVYPRGVPGDADMPGQGIVFRRIGASRLCSPLWKASGTGIFLPGILR